MLGGNLGSLLYGDVSVMFVFGDRMLVLIVPVPGHCLLFTSTKMQQNKDPNQTERHMNAVHIFQQNVLNTCISVIQSQVHFNFKNEF